MKLNNEYKDVEILISKKEYKNALLNLTNNKKSKINDEDYYYGLIALCQNELGDYFSAKDNAEKSLSLNPNHNPFALAQKGNALLCLNNLDEAITYLDKAISIKNDYTFALAKLGKCYYLKNEFNKAVDILNIALKFDNKDDWIYVQRGICEYCLNDYNKAIESFSKSLSINENNEWALYHRGVCYNLLKDYKKAASDLNKIIHNMDSFDNFYLERFYANFHSENWSKAYRDIQNVNLDYNKNDELIFLKANLLSILKQKEKSILEYNKVLKINPFHSRARIGMALEYFWELKLKESLFHLKIVLENDPQNKKAEFLIRTIKKVYLIIFSLMCIGIIIFLAIIVMCYAPNSDRFITQIEINRFPGSGRIIPSKD